MTYDENRKYFIDNAATLINKSILNYYEDKLKNVHINYDIKETLHRLYMCLSFLYKEELAKVRKLSKHIIDTLKKMYKGECQLCGGKVGEQYGKEIVEAHHIEYFSQTQNNDPSNIIILCPNCHALIHKCNPAYDKKTCSFKFDNGKILSVKTKGHLKGKL